MVNSYYFTSTIRQWIIVLKSAAENSRFRLVLEQCRTTLSAGKVLVVFNEIFHSSVLSSRLTALNSPVHGACANLSKVWMPLWQIQYCFVQKRKSLRYKSSSLVPKTQSMSEIPSKTHSIRNEHFKMLHHFPF